MKVLISCCWGNWWPSSLPSSVFFPWVFVPRRLRSSFFYCLKFFSVNWVLLLTAHLFLWRTKKIPFIFSIPPSSTDSECTEQKDTVRERAKRIRSNEVQELFMMLSSVETWPMCLIFWGFCTSGRMHDGRGKRKGNFPNVQHFRREIGQFVLKVKLM